MSHHTASCLWSDADDAMKDGIQHVDLSEDDSQKPQKASTSFTGCGGDRQSPSATCWLCCFSSNPKAVACNQFINEHAAVMCFEMIAEQIQDHILESYPEASGASSKDILQHICTHMVSPPVKFAGIVRDLSSLAYTLKGGLCQKDAETDEILIDVRNSELYLKALAQLTAVYRADGSKVLGSR